jgi:hypothetical protein
MQYSVKQAAQISLKVRNGNSAALWYQLIENSSVVNLLVILQAGNALLMNSIGHSRLVVEALSG